MAKKGELPVKQQLFVSEYLKDFNATRAAIDARYSKKTAGAMGHELLKKPKIMAAVSKRIDEIISKNDEKVAQVIRDLQEIKDRCMEATEVMIFDKALKRMVPHPDGIWTFDSKGAIQAITLLGKYLSMFTDKQEVIHKGNIEINIDKDDAKL